MKLPRQPLWLILINYNAHVRLGHAAKYLPHASGDFQITVVHVGLAGEGTWEEQENWKL